MKSKILTDKDVERELSHVPTDMTDRAMPESPYTAMAREWMNSQPIAIGTMTRVSETSLAALLERVSEQERERAAQVCDDFNSCEGIAEKCAAAIRALGSEAGAADLPSTGPTVIRITPEGRREVDPMSIIGSTNAKRHLEEIRALGSEAGEKGI